jgi:hypothetical protein
MKKVLLFIVPVLLLACGGSEEDKKKGGPTDLSEQGIEATIEVGEPKGIESRDLKTNYELKLLTKSIMIELDDNLMLTIQESKDNGVAQKLDFAKSFGGEVLESSDNHYLIKEEKRGEIAFDCAYYYEKDGAWIEVRVADFNKYFYSVSLEQANKGMEMAKTFKFK